jgi:hypothetical protein
MPVNAFAWNILRVKLLERQKTVPKSRSIPEIFPFTPYLCTPPANTAGLNQI